MTFMGKVSLALFVWAFVSTISIAVIKKYLKGARRFLFGGAIFLVLTQFAMMALNLVFEDSLLCKEIRCLADKTIAESLLTFFLITWGAIGGALLAKLVEESDSQTPPRFESS